MWIEAILTRDDLCDLLEQMLPLRIQLGEGEPERYLYLGNAREVSLVPGEGLRVECAAKVRMGLPFGRLPIGLRSVHVLVKPRVRPTPEGDVLVFGLEVESADLKLVPEAIDRRIVTAINRLLEEKHVEAVWNFTRTLTHQFALPALLQPVNALKVRVKWGEVKITEEGLSLAVSFEARSTRKRRVRKAAAAA